MSNTKQTAVTILQEAILLNLVLNAEQIEMINSFSKQAKAMEKEQICKAHEKGGDIIWQYQHNNEPNGEQYYKETYGE